MIKLKNCCFCVALKLGTIIIGAVEIVWALGSIGIGMGGLGYIPLAPPFVVQIITIAMVVIWLVVSALLIAGTIQNRPRFIYIYIVGIAVVILISAAFHIVSMVFFLLHNLITMVISMAVLLALELIERTTDKLEEKLCGISTVLQIYLWLVVCSYYKEVGGGGE